MRNRPAPRQAPLEHAGEFSVLSGHSPKKHDQFRQVVTSYQEILNARTYEVRRRRRAPSSGNVCQASSGRPSAIGFELPLTPVIHPGADEGALFGHCEGDHVAGPRAGPSTRRTRRRPR
jgi:hypothetical protein